MALKDELSDAQKAIMIKFIGKALGTHNHQLTKEEFAASCSLEDYPEIDWQSSPSVCLTATTIEEILDILRRGFWKEGIK